MLMSVAEVSDLIGLSKVSIYNKIKIKDIEQYVVKNRGITYISEEGVNLIKRSLNINGENLNGLKNNVLIEDKEVAVSLENKEIKEQLKELNKDYLSSLKGEIKSLKEQLVEKDRQIQELINLNKNNQVLLKQDQEKNQLQLEEHFQHVDQKISDIREKMLQKKEQKKGLLNFWK